MTKQLLALAGLITVTGVALAAAPEGPKPDRPRGERHGKASLKESLGLTDAQEADLKKLRTEQAKRKIRLGADMKIAQLELRELLLAPTVDEKAVRAKAKQVSDLQTAAATERVEAMLALRKVVNAEQAEKLFKMHAGRKGHGPRKMQRLHGPRGPQGPQGRGPRPPRGPRTGDADFEMDEEAEEENL